MREKPVKKPWPDYNAVWRWHFYAGLLCIPFILWLSVTGSIYVFKPQIESWLERAYDHQPPAAYPVAASAQVQAALRAAPGAQFSAYELPKSGGAAARVLLSKGDQKLRVYVGQDGRVLKVLDEDQRFMKQISFLHGELAIGDRGSAIVEIAACWAIVMILTGLFLWWPRSIKALGGVLFPRLNHGGRFFWRDMHAVTGFWVSALALFLLLSGLPWAKNWGGYLKEVRAITGTAEGAQDWTTGRTSELAARRAQAPEHDHGHSPGMMMEMPSDYAALDRLAPIAAAQKLAPPVLVAPPRAMDGAWTIKSDAQNRPLRATLMLNGATGAILSRKDFNQRHPIDQIIGVGIAAHEGALFGWINQALSVTAALGLILLCVSAVILWLRRKPENALGAPQMIARPRLSAGLLITTLLLAVLFPLFGASLLLSLVVERLVLRRIAPVRHWLGLAPA